MHIVLLGSEQTMEDWKFETSTHKLTRVTELQHLTQNSADLFIDMMFEFNPDRIELLKNLQAPVMINDVSFPLYEIEASFIRFNGWPTFLDRPLIEVSCITEMKETATGIFNLLNRKMEWVPDTPGFITPRIISMIINEAYYSLGDGVSTKADIDIAMKLGTSYPYGPFEWSELIGLENINELLQQMMKSDKKYSPAQALTKALTQWP